jgi:hypothetical protein
MKALTVIALALLFAEQPALVGAADAPFNAAQRQAQIDRVRDGLNSPDPTKRLVTLEQAIAMKDRTLRRVALSTAFASADSDLRSAALGAAVASSATFVVDIVGAESSNSSHQITSKLGSSFEVQILGFDAGRNAFQTSSSYSIGKSSGAVSGDRLSFDISVARLFYHSQFSEIVNQCRGVARLQGGSALLKGSLSCTMQLDGYQQVSENYAITIDMLK